MHFWGLNLEDDGRYRHGSKPLLTLLDKAEIKPDARVHADRAYCSQTRWVRIQQGTALVRN